MPEERKIESLWGERKWVERKEPKWKERERVERQKPQQEEQKWVAEKFRTRKLRCCKVAEVRKDTSQ